MTARKFNPADIVEFGRLTRSYYHSDGHDSVEDGERRDVLRARIEADIEDDLREAAKSGRVPS